MSDFSALRPLTADLPPIVILSSLDHDGAGIAALRLHQGLVAAGANAKMVVLGKTSGDVTVGELKADGAPLWKQVVAEWAKVALDYPASSTWQEPFTTVAAPFNVAELDLVQSAGLVNLHWCAGMLPWPAAGTNLRGKTLVWTLDDMNPFTGCCHYVGACERWRLEGCQQCPRLGPSKSGVDLAAKNFAAKRDGYAGLDLHVVTPSKWLGDCAGQSVLLGQFPHTVIPYGFPLDEFSPLDRATARATLGLPGDRKIILFGASLCGCQRKGMHLLVEAMPQLAKKWPGEPPVLAVFGNPSGMPAMPPGFECHTLGRLEGNEALSRAYSAADVFVIPSMEEVFGNVIVEAQACGTPSVGFAIGGIPDIIVSPALGRLAQPFDTNDLADKIREVLLASPEEAAAARKDCREHAEVTYSECAQTVSYLRLYRQLLGLPAIEPAMSPMGACPANESPSPGSLAI